MIKIQSSSKYLKINKMTKTLIRQLKEYWLLLTVVGTILFWSYTIGQQTSCINNHLSQLDSKTKDIKTIEIDINDIKISECVTSAQIKDLRDFYARHGLT